MNCSAIPNPLARQAQAPPAVARELQVSSLVYAGCLGAIVWDILSNMFIDYDIMLKTGFSKPAVVYCFSRLSSLGFLLGAAIYRTVPLGRCYGATHIVNTFIPLSIASSSLLLFLRVRAVFNANHVVVSTFFVSWLAVLASTITVPIALKGSTIGRTSYCAITHLPRYTVVATIVPLINDACVCLAISWRLLQNSHAEYRQGGFSSALRTFVSGKHLPEFSRSLLQGGQKYYALMVISNLLVLIMMLIPVSNTYHTMFMIPNVLIMNSMACLVYRRTKLGRIAEESISTRIMFAPRNVQSTLPEDDSRVQKVHIVRTEASASTSQQTGSSSADATSTLEGYSFSKVPGVI